METELWIADNDGGARCTHRAMRAEAAAIVSEMIAAPTPATGGLRRRRHARRTGAPMGHGTCHRRPRNMRAMTDTREQILWDSNRLGRATQRQFHAAVQEVRGERVMVSPAVASELAPRVDLENLERSITRLNEDLKVRREEKRPAKGPGGTLEIAADLWRAREWRRPDGLYGVRRLTPQEQNRKVALLDEAPRAIFTEAVTREDVLEDPDAHIVCEALAMDAVLLMTYDKNTIKKEHLALWTGALARRGVVSHPRVVRLADEVGQEWTGERPEEMLLGSMLAAWAPQAGAGPMGMRKRWEEKIAHLPAAGLGKTATALKAVVGNNWEQFDALCELLNKGLPVQMRNAERRSPYIGWNGPEEAPRRTEYSLTWTGDTMILTHESVSGRTHEWGRWRRKEMKEMAQFLAARNIGITGMPTPKDTGGFTAAMERTIKEMERERRCNRT